jgi:hypothetical protein
MQNDNFYYTIQIKTTREAPMSLEHAPRKRNHSQPSFSVEDRLAAGAFTVREVCELLHIGRATLDRHRKAGLITVTKRGRKCFITGPNLRAYKDAVLTEN